MLEMPNDNAPAGYVPLDDVLRIIDMTVLGRVWCRECESYDEECGCGMADESKHVNERHREELKRHIRGLVPPSAPDAVSTERTSLEWLVSEWYAQRQILEANGLPRIGDVYGLCAEALEDALSDVSALSTPAAPSKPSEPIVRLPNNIPELEDSSPAIRTRNGRKKQPSEREWIADAVEKERTFFESASDEEIEEHLHPGMAALREREAKLVEALGLCDLVISDLMLAYFTDPMKDVVDDVVRARSRINNRVLRDYLGEALGKARAALAKARDAGEAG